MERRTVLKIVTLAALAPTGINASGKSGPLNAAWVPADSRLHFFTEEEDKMLDSLMEMIVPADEHSPGAHAAQVSLFADVMVSTNSDEVKKQWRKGLQLMREEAARSSLGEALAKSTAHEGNPETDLERFFSQLKEMTVNGYYTSAIGIHRDLRYQGNTYLNSFPGCTRETRG